MEASNKPMALLKVDFGSQSRVPDFSSTFVKKSTLKSTSTRLHLGGRPLPPSSKQTWRGNLPWPMHCPKRQNVNKITSIESMVMTDEFTTRKAVLYSKHIYEHFGHVHFCISAKSIFVWSYSLNHWMERGIIVGLLTRPIILSSATLMLWIILGT